MTTLLEKYKHLQLKVFRFSNQTANFLDACKKCESEEEIGEWIDYLLEEGQTLEEILEQLQDGGLDDSHLIVKVIIRRLEEKKKKPEPKKRKHS